MPWNDNSNGGGQRPSGGPWGEGPRQPWGPPPPRGPREPQNGNGPDLEEMMRRFQERMSGGRGRRGAGSEPPRLGGGGLAVLGALLAAGWIASGIYVVDSGEQAVVTRFGAFNRVSEPGLHLHLPGPIEAVRVESVTRQRQTTIGFRETQDVLNESLMLTGDKSIVDVDFTVVWRLSDVQDFVFNLRDPEEAVKAVAESSMREVVGQRQLDAIITVEQQAISQATQQLMQRTLDAYGAGVQIDQVQLQRPKAPAEVNEAFQDVIKAGQDQETAINQATRYANEIVPKARGEAAKMLQDAEGYKEQVVREAVGEAERFRLVAEQYRTAPRVTRERLYLETMERVFGGADKIIVDQRSGVTPFLPLDQLRRQGAAPAAPPTASANPPGAR
jgi:membrane protease subunit HflK